MGWLNGGIPTPRGALPDDVKQPVTAFERVLPGDRQVPQAILGRPALQDPRV